MKKTTILILFFLMFLFFNTAFASQDCISCHKQEADSFSLTRHSKDNDCSICHGDTKKHLTESIKKGNIVNPANLPLKKSNTICLDCHENKAKNISDKFSAITDSHNELRCYECHNIHLLNSSDSKDLDLFKVDLSADCSSCHSEEVEELSSSPHGSSRIKCLDCHKLHNPMTQSEVIENQIDTCLSCHPSQELEFKYPYVHPLREKQLTCSSCHEPHSSRYDAMLKKDTDKVCGDCHTDILIEGGKHPISKRTDHPFNTVKCMSCHKPHGSNFNKILKHSENSICKTCHN